MPDSFAVYDCDVKVEGGSDSEAERGEWSDWNGWRWWMTTTIVNKGTINMKENRDSNTYF